jgi:hypothetical protein
MIVKESEVYKKRCVFNAMNRDVVFVCVGSKCMAWIFLNTQEGYCGMVQPYNTKIMEGLK